MITETDLAKLTHRQREVLTALAQQLSSDEVARFFHIAGNVEDRHGGNSDAFLPSAAPFLPAV